MSLRILHSNSIKNNLIIFVHGLGGNINTFKNKFGDMFHDFFDNLILENCDIGYFEYPTSLWYCKTLSLASNIPLIGNKIQYKFNTNIDTLTDLLKTEYDINKSKYKNIHFIGHSLGGIIIKNFLVNYYEDNSKKPFFITLSTPHNGSPYAEKFSFFSNPQISELKYKSEILIRLSDSFKKKKSSLIENIMSQ